LTGGKISARKGIRDASQVAVKMVAGGNTWVKKMVYSNQMGEGGGRINFQSPQNPRVWIVGKESVMTAGRREAFKFKGNSLKAVKREKLT